MIKNDSIEKLLDIVQIEDLIGDYVQLKRRGANYIGCCPFHDEKTPSFTVSATKGIFKCFGCGEAGNSIGFIMKHEQLSFVEAVRLIAQRYNFELEETKATEEELQQRDERETLYIVSKFAQEYYQTNLFTSQKGKDIGLSYFKHRGFTDQTIQKFGLGFAFDGFHHFLNHAKKSQYELDTLVKAGLVSNKNGNQFDFFRDRVIFPIHNANGKTIAFAGRTLKSDKKIPKYINSAETDIYNKSRVLYGMHLAKKEISKQDNCYIVEGYTDVISLHQSGVENVVASSGTSLTHDQIRLVKRYTQNITLLFDGDQAGIKAALRGVNLILPQDINVRVIALPEEHDPDSFIKELGYDGFHEFAQKHTQDFILFKLNNLLKEQSNDPVKRAEATRSIVESISLIPDSIKRSFYVRECASILQIEEQLLHLEINKKIRYEKAKHSKLSKQDKTLLDEQEKSKIISEPQRDQKQLLADKNAFAEKEVVRVLLEYGHLAWEENVLSADYILFELEEQTFKNEKFQIILDFYRQEREQDIYLELDQLFKTSNQKLLESIIEVANSPYELSKNWFDKHEIFIETDKEELYQKDIIYTISSYKLFVAQQMLEQKQNELKQGNKEFEEEFEILKDIQHFKQIIVEENKRLGRNNYLH